MSATRINAIIYKQVQDTLKNKSILIQFVMFPVMASILTFSAKDFGLEPSFFVNMFAAMYVTMAPIIVVSTIVSEDKEKGALQMLRMSNVKPFEYLVGVALYVFVLCAIGLLFMAIVGGYTSNGMIVFLLANMAGLIISILIGSIIGLLSPNQSASSGLSVPAMLIFSFLPMLSMFNSSIHNFSKYIYSQQVSDIISTLEVNVTNIITLVINFVIVLVLYLIVYKKYKFK
ncbi:ABC transporter permease [Breznakia pachnodae]|uniref:ABC-2 type transport system permease protein n=1 Tax=Breznakia pachnodae TaxID=265178 RepID=A0ABU0E5E2_9FIRM|nr:ABC transporter permease [Breznakia pachnodae]MDQ0362036.1 ABC-2 type transport system permease protein [Breznakia pachnodae]